MQFYCISACYVTPGPRLEVRCRNTMSKHVTANAVEVEAKTLRRNPRRNSERRAGCPPQRRSEWWRPVRGGGPAACNPVDREGDGNRGCISVFRYWCSSSSQGWTIPRKLTALLHRPA